MTAILTAATSTPQQPDSTRLETEHPIDIIDNIPMSRLTGWGRTSPSVCRTCTLTNTNVFSDPRITQSSSLARGVVARGLGRSYNDAAQNAGGIVISANEPADIQIDPATGVLTANASASLTDLISAALQHGFFVPVTPGTRHVSFGGAIAADVHGKNHRLAGTIGTHIQSIVLDTPVGTKYLTPNEHPELFWATVGGMGLTGVIRTATMNLLAIPTPLMRATHRRTNDFDDTLQSLDSDTATYAIAWLHGSAKGHRLGCGILSSGEHANTDALATDEVHRISRFVHRDHDEWFARAIDFPEVPVALIRPWSTKIFAGARFHHVSRHGVTRLETLGEFFHPLDRVGHANRLYGNAGFIQWQCALPHNAHEVIRHVLDELSAAHLTSPLITLKRLGRSGVAPLSFPLPGWTLAVDLPNNRDVYATLDCLDELVVNHGGRLYLAKDSRMRPELLEEMYPRINEWRTIRNRIDPNGQIQSDLDRRLNLTGQTKRHPDISSGAGQ